MNFPQTNELAAKIAAKNRVNAAIKEKAPQIFKAIEPFLGKKVVLASGLMSVKLKEVLQPFLDRKEGENLQIYTNSLSYSLSLIFKTSENVEGKQWCIYQESSVYFADIKDGVLASFYPFKVEDFRSNYELNEILATLAELKAAEEKVSQIASKLPCFVQ